MWFVDETFAECFPWAVPFNPEGGEASVLEPVVPVVVVGIPTGQHRAGENRGGLGLGAKDSR